LDAYNETNFQLFLVPNITFLLLGQFVSSHFSCLIVLSVNVNISPASYIHRTDDVLKNVKLVSLLINSKQCLFCCQDGSCI